MVRAPAASEPDRMSEVQSISAVHTPAARDANTRSVRLWLLAVAALVFAMVVVGGATRLTGSGLSIVEWKPVTGALPPLSAGDWQIEFEKYKAIPQYRALNHGMSIDDFKTIYWWEWTHRFLGRVIGVAFLVPFLWFLWRGWITPRLHWRLWLIFALGALQGGAGWLMVVSGLSELVRVSQYWLAFHLTLACVIFAALVWTAGRLASRAGAMAPFRMRASAVALLVLVLVQIYLGALVAGLRAGLIYNTWPSIDGAFVPEASRLFFQEPLWRNFFENALTVQFAHRLGAYVLFALAMLHAADVMRALRRGPARATALALAVAVTIQAAIGVVTLVHHTPIALALLHQGMAMVVLALAVVHAQRLAARRSGASIAASRA